MPMTKITTMPAAKPSVAERPSGQLDGCLPQLAVNSPELTSMSRTAVSKAVAVSPSQRASLTCRVRVAISEASAEPKQVRLHPQARRMVAGRTPRFKLMNRAMDRSSRLKLFSGMASIVAARGSRAANWLSSWAAPFISHQLRLSRVLHRRRVAQMNAARRRNARPRCSGSAGRSSPVLARAIQTATKGGVASQGSIGRGMSSPAYTAAISKISKAAAAEMPPAVQTYQR